MFPQENQSLHILGTAHCVLLGGLYIRQPGPSPQCPETLLCKPRAPTKYGLTFERSQQASPAGSVSRVLWTRSVDFKPGVYAAGGGKKGDTSAAGNTAPAKGAVKGLDSREGLSKSFLKGPQGEMIMPPPHLPEAGKGRLSRMI